MVRDTSKESYDKIKSDGLLGHKQMQIYQYLFVHGPLNANQIFRGIKGKTSITQANIHARLNELKKAGCVSEVGKKFCKITERKVYMFDVTSKLPKKIINTETKDQKIKRLENIIEQQKKVIEEKDEKISDLECRLIDHEIQF